MAYLLLVDDDEDFASAAAMVLRDAGFEVEIKLDTRSALERMKERTPDLAILDVMFPEDSAAGFTLARNMAAEEKLKPVPVLLLTAVNARFPLGFGAGDLDEAWLPANEFLEKPVDLDALQAKVKSMLGT